MDRTQQPFGAIAIAIAIAMQRNVGKRRLVFTGHRYAISPKRSTHTDRGAHHTHAQHCLRACSTIIIHCVCQHTPTEARLHVCCKRGFKRADRACTSTDRSLHRYKRRHRACDIISKQRHRQRHRQQHQHITRCCDCDHISASKVCFKPVKACTQQCASRTFRSCTSMFDGPVCIIPQVSSR